jgi:hypothetical protein
MDETKRIGPLQFSRSSSARKWLIYVYAIDADNRNRTAELLWDDDLGISGQAPGIYGTPVIALDQHGGGTLYVVTNDSPQAEHLHALDITNGQPRSGSPMPITPRGFRPSSTYERTGLALVNGVIYGGWRADEFSKVAEHGWVMAFDVHTLKLISAFNTTADGDTIVHGQNLGNGLALGNPGSVWQSTTGLSVDADGNVYPVTGNGPFTGNKGGNSYGDSFLKLHLVSRCSISTVCSNTSRMLLEGLPCLHPLTLADAEVLARENRM